MIYYSYTKQTEEGPNGFTKSFNLPEGGFELATVDGLSYVSVPDDAVIPEQWAEINAQVVTLTDELRDSIKAQSGYCRLVDQQIRTKIREKYDSEDEMYLTRISVGALAGMYTYLPGEAEAVVAYGQYIEGIRQWGRDERAKVGL